MIETRIRQLMKEAGIPHPLAAMKKAGISQGVGEKYLSGEKKWILVKHVEILCKLLRCTPNDLYEWTPDNLADDYPQNPLQAIRKRASFNLEELLKTMTLEDIKKKLGLNP